MKNLFIFLFVLFISSNSYAAIGGEYKGISQVDIMTSANIAAVIPAWLVTNNYTTAVTLNNNLVVTGNGTFTGAITATTNETINGIDIQQQL